MRKLEPKTKIICTLGPASQTESVIRNMAAVGMDVVRLNFSHADHSAHRGRIDLVRKINKKDGKDIKILQDLEGYRIRIGRLKDRKPLEVKKRQTIFLTQEDIVGEKGIIPFNYKGDLADIKGAKFIYIDDGNIALKLKAIRKRGIEACVVAGGLIKEHKGVNIPGARLKFSGITDKDRQDIRFGVANKVDFMAQSFVRTQDDILNIRKLVGPHLPKCQIIAKIENREGIKNIDEIIEVSDGIMIARGDMGVSVPIYEIPVIQKMIIKRCNKNKRFAITATQMLESMTENIRPTRAEVTDVANAILDGTDYVMLSAETAVGRHPVEVVKMMEQIVAFTEDYLYGRSLPIYK